jgi:hypothetical protein
MSWMVQMFGWFRAEAALASCRNRSNAIPCHIFREEFKGYEAIKAGVLGLVHHAHPAPAEFLEDALEGDGLADEGVGVRHSDDILAPAAAPRRLGGWKAGF